MKSKAYLVVDQLLHENWEPRLSDIEWLKRLMASLKHNGVWAIPTSNNVYQVNHEDKTLTLVQGKIDALFHRTRKIASKFGYRVISNVEGPNEEDHMVVVECGATGLIACGATS